MFKTRRGDYLFTNSKHFKYISFSGNTLPFQGWKIHVSSIFKTYPDVLKIVKSYCFAKRINFKFVYKKKDVVYFLSKQINRRAFAKLITIYPIDNEETRRIIKDLFLLLRGFKGPEIFTDIPYKDSIIQYRYRNFFNKDEVNLNGEGESKKIFLDNRNPGFYKPSEEIPDLFDGDLKFLEEVGNINGYIPKTPLHLSSFGGIFIVEKGGKFLIMKEGRPHVGFGSYPEGDAIFYRKNEVLISKRINSKFFPRLIDYFEKEKHFFSIFELKKLNTISQWKEHLCFVFSNNTKVIRKKKIERLVKKLITALVSLLKEARRLKLVLNDIKADNILWYGDKEIYFVDLDTSFFFGEHKIVIKDHFSRRERTSNFVTDVRKTGYLLFDLISNSGVLQNKHTDHNLVVRYFKYFAVEVDLDVNIRDWILHLLTFSKNSSLGIFKTGRYNSKLNFSAPIPYDKKLLEEVNFEEVVFSLAESHDIWIDAYKAIEASELTNAIRIIKRIIKEETTVRNGSFVVNVNGEYLSPYLLNGTARLMYLVLLVKERLNSDIFLNLLFRKLVPSLNSRFILKPSFLFGISGLVYIFLIAFKILKKKEFLRIARQRAEILQFFYLKKKDCFFDYDGSILSKDVQEIIEKILSIFFVDLKVKEN